MNAITRMGRRVWALGLLTGTLAQAQSLVGHTAGEPGVSPTGSARYVVPLSLPPGTNGLAPKLAIAYDSRDGNGLLGVGFRVTGLSTITPCRRTIVQDGAPGAVTLDRSDRYCLDGRRLRLTAGSYGYAGSQYQAEVEDFARVTAYGSAGNAPASFQVEARDGLVYEYGTTVDSRIEAYGSATPRAWALSRIRDRAGNAVEIAYFEDAASGSYRPARVDYAGNAAAGSSPYYSVRFVYEARPSSEPLVSFLGGSPSVESQRLDRIDVVHVATGALVRRFELTYEAAAGSGRSRLVSLQECAGGDCLPATVFAWDTQSPGWSGSDAPAGIAAAAANVVPGDADGDGCEDLLYFSSSSLQWLLLRGSPAGYAGTPVVVASSSATPASEAVSIDLDADGKRDLLVPTAGTSKWNDAPALRWLHHVSGDSFALTGMGIASVAAPGGMIAADLDGDGREDLVYVKTNSASIFWRRNLTAGGVPAVAAEAVLWTSPYGTIAPTAPFGTQPQRFRSIVRRGDFDGDGRADLLFLQQTATRTEWHALFSTGSALQTRAIIANAVAMPELGDFNGDGLTDVAYPAAAVDGSVSWRLRFGTGAAAVEAKFSAEVATAAVAAATTTMVTDWDGDGRSDLISAGSDGVWRYCRSIGTTLEACQPSGYSTAGMTGMPLVTDLDGNGLPDMVYVSGDWRYRLHRPPTDLLASATDGLGAYVRYAYAATTDRAICTPASGSLFPVRELATPFTVVSRLTRSDGNGGSSQLSFAYAGARLHLQGRGFLGFARRSSSDGRTGIERSEDVAQDPASFETIGLPLSTAIRQSSGVPIEQVSYTWSRQAFGAGFDERRFPYAATIVVNRYELDGARVTSTATSNVYDAFGTLADQSTVVTEVARGSNPGAQHTRRVTLSGITNDVVNWCLGKPASIVERRSHTLAGGTEIVRTTGQAWDYARCRPAQEVVEPLSATLRVTTDYAYDDWGNVAAQTVTPVGQAPRRTSAAWIENGRFVGNVGNALGQVTSFAWDAQFARLTEIRDPNGRVARWTYDALNRRTRATAPDGTSVAWQRWTCGSGNCAWPGARYAVAEVRRGVGDAYVATDVTGFDGLDRPVYAQHELPGGASTLEVRRYDSLGRLAQQSPPGLCCNPPSTWITRQYDLLDRRLLESWPASEGNPSGSVNRWGHDGLTATSTDPLGRVTIQRRDAIGRVLQVVDAAGADTDYEYDAFGDLLKVRDFAGNETALAYNAHGFRTMVQDADSGRLTYDYSPLGELRSQTNARGQTLTYAYDALGRLVSRVEPEGTTTWTWGASASSANIGQLESVSSPGFQESYRYDALGRLTSVSRSVAGQLLDARFAYDTVTGALDTLTYPSRSGATPLRLKHSYDRGRLVRLADADSPFTVFWSRDGVNALGLATAVTLGNGVKVGSAYDPVTGLLMSRNSGATGGGGLQNLQYAWDAAGNLTSRSDPARGISEQFYYDSRDRLDYVLRGGAPALDLNYDDLGNLTFKSDVGDYRYDPVHRHAVATAGANQYAYDANGAMTAANGSAFSWYSYDLPSQLAHPNGNYAAFYYGADRVRYRQVARAGTGLTETLYALGGAYERVSRDGMVADRDYIVADGEIVAVRTSAGSIAPVTVYLLKDHLGSVDGFTSETGAVLARASYQPSGARRSGDWSSGSPTASEWQQILAVTPRGFTQHEHLDNLGLIHMNGRVYDPVLGRFLSPDPILQDVYDGQALNRYGYVRNNPLRFTDPSGYCGTSPVKPGGSAKSCLEEVVFEYWNLNPPNYDWMLATFGQPRPIGEGAQAEPGGGAAPMEEIVVTASRGGPDLLAASAALAATRAAEPWLGWGARSFAMWGASAIVAGALLLPAETAATDESVDESGEPTYVYHFTNDLGVRGITVQQSILPGKSGLVYLSPIPYQSATMAQQYLALPRLPSGYLAIPRQNVASPLTWTVVQPNFGHPGGGLEASTQGPIPVEGARWVPFGP